MKPVVYAIAAAAIALALLRRFRARGRRPGHPPAHHPARPLGRLRELGRGPWRRRPLGDTGLVAAREIRERLRGRFFKVITLVLLAVVAAAIVIPTLPSSSTTAVRVGVIGDLSVADGHAALAALRHERLQARFTPERDLRTARSALRTHQVTVVIDHGKRLLVDAPVVTGASTAAARAAAAIAAALGAAHAFGAAGLSPTQAAVIAGAKPLPIQSVAPRQNGSARGASAIGLVFTFILLSQYLAWTLVGVMEEKTSRVVEVLLATVRPVQLLGGKVLGIGLVALLQAGLLVAFALVLARAVGSNILQGTAPLAVAASLVWLVLAYAFYSWVFAAAGSMVERQDQAQSLTLPLSVPIIVGYVVGLMNAGPTPTSLFMKVLAYLPPTAPFGMPLLVAKGEVSWWEFLVAALLSVASTLVVARFAATFYKRAVLRTGRRLGLREVVALGRGS